VNDSGEFAAAFSSGAMAYRSVKSVILAILLALAPPIAHADIRAFNAAVQAGDYRTAVLAASETWPTIDRNSPEAASVAREFGWIAMLADQPATALIYGKFLVEQGPSLAHPDASPVISRVLFDWASLADNPTPAARLKLYDSLIERARTHGRDLISARAAHALYAEAWAAGDWPYAAATAVLGIRFLDELGASASPAAFEMRRGRAVAAFMRAKTADSYNAVYDVAAELYDAIAREPEGAIRDRLATEFFAATAWGDAMYSALGDLKKTTPDRRNTFIAGKPPINELLYPAPGDASLPRCRVSLARNFKQPGFPYNSRFKDFAGEVIYALDVEPDGAFSSPQLLAVAPHDGFAEAVADVVSSWRWKVDGPAPPGCRLPKTHILTFEFALGR
jgi:hypothetical protein